MKLRGHHVILATLAATVAVLGAVLPGDTANADPKNGPKVSTWVHTDLRVPSLDQLRMAGARRAMICKAGATRTLGNVLTNLLGSVATQSIIPDFAASELACAFDAPRGTTCEALKACGGDDPASQKHDRPVCEGCLLHATTRRSERPVTIACPAFGEKCFQTDFAGICGDRDCKDGETYACEDDEFVACMHGIRTRTPCGNGRKCGPDGQTKMIGCWGKGPACSGAGHCDGAVAVNCDQMGPSPREVPIDCGRFRMACDTTSAPSGRTVAVCGVATGPGACDPFTEKATCDQKQQLNVCVAGTHWTVSCHELGFSRCSPSGGPGGEATCI